MIRLTRTIFTTLARPNTTLISFNLPLVTLPRYCFSLHSSNKVLEMIKKERREDNLDRICIEIASLQDSSKEKAVAAVLDKIKEGEFSPATIVHEKYNIHLKKYPNLLYEAYELRILQSLN